MHAFSNPLLRTVGDVVLITRDKQSTDLETEKLLAFGMVE